MDAALKSCIAYDAEHPFPLENIPFGCFKRPDGKIHCCTRIGDKIVDLAVLFPHFKGPHFSTLSENVFEHHNLNKFAALGKDFRIEARETLQKMFAEGQTPEEAALFDAGAVEMTMPMFIRDYTDFYSSKNHAYNIGVMFRGPDNALQPNWVHVPVGYHGRASSVVVDNTPIVRPKG
jgi:fumarylacetoacetase